MREIILCIALLLGILATTAEGGQRGPSPRRAEPRQFTIVVYHDECTECGDIEIDSGEVKVPLTLRERYLQAFAKSPRSGPGDYSAKYGRCLAYCHANGWRVGNMKLKSEGNFENLFLLAGKKPSNSYDSSDNPWDFNRRYRVTVEVVGIKWSYLTVRVRKSVRQSDRKNY